jgi:hypothetical protein
MNLDISSPYCIQDKPHSSTPEFFYHRKSPSLLGLNSCDRSRLVNFSESYVEPPDKEKSDLPGVG